MVENVDNVENEVLVVIPTYNESLNLIDVISRIRATELSLDILIVDDNSPDGTGDIAETLSDDHTHVLHRATKSGLGPAYLEGFQWGIQRNYRYFVEMDADGSHLPEELPRLLSPRENFDLVIGTRWIKGGSVVNWPLHRKVISRCGTWYAAFALGLPYKDLTSGFKVLNQELIHRILESEISTKGYGFQIETVRIASGAKPTMKIEQVPITFVERTAGQSKMSREIVFEAWKMTTIWALQRIFKRR